MGIQQMFFFGRKVGNEIVTLENGLQNLSLADQPHQTPGTKNIGKRFQVRNHYSTANGDQKRQKTFEYNDRFFTKFYKQFHTDKDRSLFAYLTHRHRKFSEFDCLGPYHRALHKSIVVLALRSAKIPNVNKIVFPGVTDGVYRAITSTGQTIGRIKPATYDLNLFKSWYQNSADKNYIMSNPDATLLEGTFHITDINSEKYDRVSRLTLQSEEADVTMTLDVNTELYPCRENEKLHILCSTTLSLDGSKDEKGWRDVARAGGNGEPTLADMYDYVCHGKVYRFEEDANANSM